MRDQFERNINYMRVSVTDLCNLRCVYCMPKEGIRQISHDEILTFDEIARVCRIGAELGISRIKLTGGEPLVRKGIEDLAEMICRIPGIEQVTLTTNGILLKDKLPALKKAGISAVNISLDTMDRAQYQELTGKDCLLQIMEGIRAALEQGMRVKINCVALNECNESQWGNLAALAKEYPMDVRFIEMMPIGLGKAYQGSMQEYRRTWKIYMVQQSRIQGQCVEMVRQYTGSFRSFRERLDLSVRSPISSAKTATGFG